MHVRVRLFAALAETAGVRSFDLELAEGATADDVKRALVQLYPALGGLCERVALAVNAEYVDASQRLREGDEVAVIPPVSGG